MLSYALTLAHRYDGLVIATFPDIPEAVAYGRDHDEAYEEAIKALEATLARYHGSGRDLPYPATPGNLTITTEKFGFAPA